jgi:hypothetical protein
MRFRTLPLLAALFAMSLPMMADTTYTYTGNLFTTAATPFTASDSISGYFTTSSPIAANTGNFSSGPFGPAVTGVPILDVTSFSFTDGVDTITDTSPGVATPILNFATDGSGNILAWQVDISLFSGADIFFSYQNPAGFGFSGNDGALDASGDYGGNSDPGTFRPDFARNRCAGRVWRGATQAGAGLGSVPECKEPRCGEAFSWPERDRI